jgi:glycerate kinase
MINSRVLPIIVDCEISEDQIIVINKILKRLMFTNYSVFDITKDSMSDLVTICDKSNTKIIGLFVDIKQVDTKFLNEIYSFFIETESIVYYIGETCDNPLSLSSIAVNSRFVLKKFLRILVLISNFKKTITSKRLGEITSTYFRGKGYHVDAYPISDGGDGYLDALSACFRLKKQKIRVKDPLYRGIDSYYLTNNSGEIAYIEVSQVSGIVLLKDTEKNPYLTTSYGVGQVIDEAIKKGAKTINIGLGGSATNDLGAGMLEALGAKFYDEKGKIIKKVCPDLFYDIKSIDFSEFKKKVSNTKIVFLIDVNNPLFGSHGCTYIYSKQKGLKESDFPDMESRLKHLESLISKEFPNKNENLDGSGASGGLGYTLYTCFNSKKDKGIDTVLDWINYKEIAKTYNYIITGEGKIDIQTFYGKSITGVIEHAAQNNKIVLLAARIELTNQEKEIYSKYQTYSIVPKIASLKDSLLTPEKYFKKLLPLIKIQ